MLLKNDDSIPFYIKQGDPFLINIIDDTLYRFVWEEYSLNEYIDTTLHFQQALYENDTTRKAIPKEFWQYFEELEKANFNFPKHLCSFGYSPGDECRYIHCLTMNMTIHPENHPKIVRLSHFASIEKGSLPAIPISKNRDTFFLVESSSNENPSAIIPNGKAALIAKIAKEVNFTAEEAFILFANINLIKLGYEYAHPPLDDEIQRGLVKKDFSYRFNDRIPIHVDMFYQAYLNYISKQLLAGIFLPEQILRLNGATTLGILKDNPIVQTFIKNAIHDYESNFDSLSRNKKILYLLLFYSGAFKTKLVHDFLTKNNVKIESLKKELVIQTQPFEYKVMSWEEIFQ